MSAMVAPIIHVVANTCIIVHPPGKTYLTALKKGLYMLSFGIMITQGNSTGISILTAQKTYRITIPVTLHISVRFFFFLNAANISIRTLPHRMLIITEKNVIFISFNYSRSFAIIPSSSFISFSFSS